MMTIPVWVLLGFASWTIIILFSTVGVHRWNHILTGQAEPKELRADNVSGTGWYPRAMRAHANCIENLPVYGAIVVALVVSGFSSRTIDILAIILICARVCQSVVHVSFKLTNLTTSIRFVFYFIQIVCMLWMITALTFSMI